MTSRTSWNTGNTIYYSEDGRFSSMNPQRVKDFEACNPKLETHGERTHWFCAGHLLTEGERKQYLAEFTQPV